VLSAAEFATNPETPDCIASLILMAWVLFRRNLGSLA
jgi:hypothetical protein